MTTAKAALVSGMTEDDLKLAVIEALLLYGWLVHSDRRSDLALQQGSAGFPDVVACHPSDGRLLFLELKSEQGVLSPEQHRWLFALGKAGWPRTRVLFPRDLDDFLKDPFVQGVPAKSEDWWDTELEARRDFESRQG